MPLTVNGEVTTAKARGWSTVIEPRGEVYPAGAGVGVGDGVGVGVGVGDAVAVTDGREVAVVVTGVGVVAVGGVHATEESASNAASVISIR